MTHRVTANPTALGLRDGRWRRAALAAAAAAAFLLIAPLTPAQASARTFGPAHAVAPPTDTSVPQNTDVGGIACVSATTCLAGGSYHDSSGHYEPVVAAKVNGVWKRAVKIALPKNAFAPPQGSVTAVGCVSSGNCVAVGSYGGPSNYITALIAKQSNGAWSRGVSPALPASAASSHAAQLDWVSCASNGFCEAIGNYLDSLGKWQIMAITKPAGGGWKQAVKVAPPADASGGALTSMNGIYCRSAGNCVAVGYYMNTSNVIQAMGAVQTQGHWHAAVRITPPANAASGATAELEAVSCAGTTCYGVGDYYLAGGIERSMTVKESGGTFAKAGGVSAVPAGAAAQPDTYLQGISCAPTTPCVAVGGYTNAAGHVVAMYLLASGAGWTAKSLQQPANASTGSDQESGLEAVACQSSGHCTAVGYYRDNTSGYRAEAASS